MLRRGAPYLASAVALTLALGLSGCAQKAPDVNISAPAGQAGTERGPDELPDGITVSGEGEVQGAPDTLTVTLGVSLKRGSVSSAVTDAGIAAAKVLDAIAGAGVTKEDTQTSNYSVNPEFRYPQNAAPVPDGFRVTNTLTIKIRDLDKAGSTIDAATAAGGNDVALQGVAFTLEDDSAALDGARERAFNAAKGKAEQYAELAGRPVGSAQAVRDTIVTPQPLAYTGFAARGAVDAANETPIEAGQVTTKVTVNVRYSFG
jgi:uncharacterized protein YggE